MTRSRPITFLASAAMIPLAALAIAACGGGGGAATASPSPKPAKATTTKTATVRVASNSLGSILVDSQGRTLYLFKADSATKSACAGACATAWPPLLAKGMPIAGKGLSASKLGTISRPGGQRQVTYNGHPLYTFVKDTKPGDTTGQGRVAFGAGGSQYHRPETRFRATRRRQPNRPRSPLRSPPPTRPRSRRRPPATAFRRTTAGTTTRTTTAARATATETSQR